MKQDFAAYHQKWSPPKRDSNINHQPVPNLMTCFQPRGYALTVTQIAEKVRPTDVVA